jgi:hypothetical protein
MLPRPRVGARSASSGAMRTRLRELAYHMAPKLTLYPASSRISA